MVAAKDIINEHYFGISIRPKYFVKRSRRSVATSLYFPASIAMEYDAHYHAMRGQNTKDLSKAKIKILQCLCSQRPIFNGQPSLFIHRGANTNHTITLIPA